MKNYRLRTVLKKHPSTLIEYRTLFKHAERKDRIGVFKSRKVENMQFDRVTTLRRTFSEGSIDKPFNILFAYCVSIPYLGFLNTDNDPETHLTLVKKYIKFYIGIPSFILRFYRMDTFFQSWYFISDALERIGESEKSWSLVSDPDIEKAADGVMDQFGIMNILRPLAKERAPLTEYDLAKWTYGRIHLEMSMSASEGLVQKNYKDIMTSKEKKQ